MAHMVPGKNSFVDAFTIGWDVGGWNCDHNSHSRDALVILDPRLALQGKTWRGKLRESINLSKDSEGWIHALFQLCGPDCIPEEALIVLAIDAPLGFSTGFLDLLAHQIPAPLLGDSEANPYLHRQTERFLFERGLKPLSAVKDMLGSQATKAMHALARLRRGASAAACGATAAG